MAITSIKRDLVGSPSIVRIVTTDTLTAITTDGYLTGEASAISTLQHGSFEWKDGDIICIDYSDGEGFFVRDSTNNKFVPEIDPGSYMLNYTTVSMTASDFNNAWFIPHLLVAATGTNTLLVLDSAQVVMTYGTTQFTGGGLAHIQYDNTGSGGGVIASSTQAAANFLDAVDTSLSFNRGIVKLPFSTTVNKGLYFSNNTIGFATGDSTFVVHIWYREIPTI